MTASARTCVNCGESLAVFQPVCEHCETSHEWTYRGPCHDCQAVVSYTEDACPECGTALSVWRLLEAEALDRDEHITVWKDAVPRPTEAGYQVHVGSFQGQWMDYRRSLGEGDIHVRSYPKRYELHHDDVSALTDPARHLLRHGPTAAAASGIGLAARFGKAVAESGRLLGATGPYRWLSADRDETEQSAD
ncbi:hypothetical protein GRX03_03510 [Halovenus sp. WSH3]|uniref:Zinc ribbon domain-containing protein n=1 Tax=Halovenus carboxidivorans TaxID=2692199 RepID=A0A6B0T3C0_9EURY|nr:hypothetical protein [Halovenus carboxidivorans]MXR50676.1 hypothetical protein [Halovenus carboxidivorans]